MVKSNDRIRLSWACSVMGAFSLLLAMAAPTVALGADNESGVPAVPPVPDASVEAPPVPAPAVEAVPAPAAEVAPVPAVEVVPAPAAEVAPAPVVEAVPAPVVEVAPAPAVAPVAAPVPAVVPVAAVVPVEPAVAKTAATADDQPMVINDREELQRQEYALAATNYETEALKAWRNRDYKGTMDYYAKAEEKLKGVSKSKKEVLKRMDKIRRCKADVTREWAQSIADDAQKYARAERFDDAIGKCRQVVELDPDSKDDMIKLIGAFTEQKRSTEFHAATMDDRVDPNKIERDNDISILLEQGKVFLANKRYGDARDCFERALVKDPTDIRAIRLLRQIDVRLDAVATERQRATKSRRLAEVSWKWIEPVSPAVASQESDLSSKRIIKDQNEGSSLHGVLHRIIIPKIEFEDATISQVIAYLKKRSQQLDPEGVGVNIILYVPKTAGGGGAAPAEAVGGGMAVPVDGAVPADGTIPGGEVAAVPAVGAGAPVTSDQVGARTLTICMNNVPMDEAIHYICMSASLKFKVERTAVLIADAATQVDDMETHFYPVPINALEGASKVNMTTPLGGGGRGAAAVAAVAMDGGAGEGATTPEGLRKTFAAYGVQFGTNAGISYNQAISKLIVRNTPAELQKIKDVLAQISVDTEQVTIESKFVEVKVTDMESLGFEWLIQTGGGNFNDDLITGGGNFNDGLITGGGSSKAQILKQEPDGSNGPLDTQLSKGLRDVNSGLGLSSGAASSIDRVLGVNSIIGQANLSTIIHALSQSSGTNLLSAPKVTAMSGNEAVLEMVEKRYFPTDWREPRSQMLTGGGMGGGGGGFETTPSSPSFGEPTSIGVILKVTPQVRDKYIIHLKLEPEVTQFNGYDKELNQQGTLGGQPFEYKYQMPIIESRKVTTEVEIYDGETLVLGGFINESEDSFKDKVPYLGDIPFIGRLFQSEAKRTVKKNLLIFVTARLVMPSGVPVRPNDTHGVPDFRY